MMAHGGDEPRMLQVQTPKSQQRLNHHPNIRTFISAPNPMSKHLWNVECPTRIRKLSNRQLRTSFEKLFGDNPKRIEFLRPQNMSINQAGELLDPWGTPYVINFPSTNSFVVLSAGKDKIFGDADDIIFHSVSNDFVNP
jgi:hypothetical protein